MKPTLQSTIGRALAGLFLTGVNLAAILAAYGAYCALKPANQIPVQAPLAAALTVAAVTVVSRWAPGSIWRPSQSTDLIWIFGWAWLWVPFVFIPLHHLTQGYLTAFSNLGVIWVFQLPTNALALGLTYGLGNPHPSGMGVI